MNATPAIALARQREATANFVHKLNVLEQLLTEGQLDRFPAGVSPSSFAVWEDVDLGVLPVSRSTLYSKDANYLPLQKRMEKLLARLSELRARRGKKSNVESSLRLKLEDAEARAQSYVDQYSTAMSELIEARKEIARLNLKLARLTKSGPSVVPMRRVIGDEPTSP